MRSLKDRLVGDEIFLEKYDGENLAPRHAGFVHAISQRLKLEKRKADKLMMERWYKINGRVE